MVKKGFFIVLLIISMLLASACDVYNTLYVKQPGVTGEAVKVPEENITVEIGDIEDIIGEIEEKKEVVIEVEEEKEISGEATVIIVDETELISLVPKAQDPDKDTLIFTFTSPLDENGEWQTTYGDAGEYTITATVSDGILTASKEVLVIVNKKEEAPIFNSFKPEETSVVIDETETVEFNVAASDLNNDELTYSWKLDGIEIGNRNSQEYKSTYEDSGSHTVKVIVSDGMFDTEKIWAVTVNNVNRNPVLTKIEDVEAEETDTVVIKLDASDPDGDDLSYEISDKRFVQDGNVFTWETTYDDSGKYSVTAMVSDGVDTTSQEFTITINNVNRAPVILDIVQK